jgi:hypothetical protein
MTGSAGSAPATLAARPFVHVFDQTWPVVRRVTRLWTIEFRWSERFRVWEQPRDAPVSRHAVDICRRRNAAYRDAEEASAELDLVWDHWSRRLPPRTWLGSLP